MKLNFRAALLVLVLHLFKIRFIGMQVIDIKFNFDISKPDFTNITTSP